MSDLHHVQKVSKRDVSLVVGYGLLIFAMLYIYFTNQMVHDFVDSWNEYLEGAIFIDHAFVPPVSVLDFAGSLYCCLLYRENVKGVKSWFEVLASVTLMQFGGTTISGILLLGSTPSWIKSRAAFPALLLAWWLVFYCPCDAFYRFIHKNTPLLFINTYLVFLSIAHAVGSWGIDGAFDSAPKSYLLSIMVGSVVPCGGGLLLELFGFLRENSYTISVTPKLFQVGAYGASSSLNRCFWMAIVYYVYLCWDVSATAKRSAHSIMAIVHTAIFLLSRHEITFDVFQFISDEFLETIEVTPAIHLGRSEEEDQHAKHD